MTLSDLRNLDPNNVGSWPGPVKFILLLLVCAGVLGAGYHFIVRDQITALEQAKGKEVDLRGVFESKQRRAANLEPLKRQLTEMKQSFGAMLRLLPNKTEIEGLLVDISQSGLAAGLEFELFKPQPEQPAEFYAVQPISTTVTGTYHEFGEFISAVAALPRIVTQHDLQIAPFSGGADTAAKGATLLRMNMTAKTYRYLDEEEIAAQAAKSSRRGKRR
jgi:type IV pilus assembly protein PilO